MTSHIKIEDAIKLCSDPKDSTTLYYTHITSEDKFYPTEEQTMDVICFLQRCDHIIEVSENIQLFKTEKVTNLIGLMSEEKRELAGKAIECSNIGTAIKTLENKNYNL